LRQTNTKQSYSWDYEKLGEFVLFLWLCFSSSVFGWGKNILEGFFLCVYSLSFLLLTGNPTFFFFPFSATFVCYLFVDLDGWHETDTRVLSRTCFSNIHCGLGFVFHRCKAYGIGIVSWCEFMELYLVISEYCSFPISNRLVSFRLPLSFFVCWGGKMYRILWGLLW